MADHQIGAILTLRDNMSDTLRGVRREQAGFRRDTTATQRVVREPMEFRVNAMAVGKAVAGIAAVVGAAALAVGKLGSEFREASNTIRIGTGATGDNLKSLNDDFKVVYSSFATNMGDASKAVADLNTRTGLSGQPLQELSTQMLKLAKITGEDLNTLIVSSTRMFGDAGVTQEDYAKALDYTFNVSQSTGIGVGKLQELMTNFGGPLRQMGFDWKTSAAMLGEFEKEGVNTELVVGSLRIALGKMAREGIAAPNKALALMIERIKGAGTAGSANAMALDMFGAKAGPDMAAAIREGRMDLDDLISTLASSPETIARAAKDTETIAEKFAVIKNKTAVVLEPLGTLLIESVEKVMPHIGNFANLIVSNMPMIQNEITYAFNVAGDAIAAAGVAIQDTKKFFEDHWSIVAPILGGIAAGAASFVIITGAMKVWRGMTMLATAAQAILNITLAANPIGITIIAIGLLVAAGVALWMNFDTVKEKASSMWITIKNAFATGVNGAIGLINSLIETINKIPGVKIPLVAKVEMSALPPTRNTYDTANGDYDGDHATGLTNVPFDGYIAKLHKGERVQTASQNPYNGGSSSGSSGGVVVNMNGTVIREEADIHKLANAIALRLEAAAANM